MSTPTTTPTAPSRVRHITLTFEVVITEFDLAPVGAHTLPSDDPQNHLFTADPVTAAREWCDSMEVRDLLMQSVSDVVYTEHRGLTLADTEGVQ